MRCDLNDIAIFLAVCDTGSFTRGGNSLGLPKSTVSTKIMALEKRLSAKLLERTTRQLRLTEAGRVYLASCRRVMAEVESGRQSVEYLNAAPRGQLRITVPFAFAHALLAPLMPKFLKLYPEIQLVIDVSNHEVDLIKENIDVALRIHRAEVDDRKAIKIVEFPQLLVASKNYFEIMGVPKAPDELMRHRVLAPANNNGLADVWGDMGNKMVDCFLKPFIDIREPETRLELIKRDLGIGWMPYFMCTEDVSKGVLLQCLNNWTIPNALLYAVTSSHMKQDIKVKAFVSFLAEHLV